MTDKERLERIIQMQYDGYTIWDMGENDLVWLIEQAERVHGKNNLIGLAGMYEDCNRMVANLTSQNKRYREAIEVAIHNIAASENLGVKFALGILEQALEESE